MRRDLEAGRAAKKDLEAGKKVRRGLEAGRDMRDLEAGRVAKRHQEVGREDPNKVHMCDTGARSSSALFVTLFFIKKFYISGFLLNQLDQIKKKLLCRIQ